MFLELLFFLRFYCPRKAYLQLLILNRSRYLDGKSPILQSFLRIKRVDNLKPLISYGLTDRLPQPFGCHMQELTTLYSDIWKLANTNSTVVFTKHGRQSTGVPSRKYDTKTFKMGLATSRIFFRNMTGS